MIKKTKNKDKKTTGFGISGHGNIHRIINITLIVIAISLLGLHMIYIDNSKKETQQNYALEIMIQIDDLAHIQFADMEARGNPSGYTGYTIFQEIDSGFHNAINLQEKFERAKKMNAFFDSMDTELHKIGGLTSDGDKERDAKYHALNDIFDQLQLNE